MIGTLVSLLVFLVVFLVVVGLAFWIVRTLSAAFGIGAPVTQVLYVLLVVACVVILLSTFLKGGWPAAMNFN
jgi:hypothetical protein